MVSHSGYRAFREIATSMPPVFRFAPSPNGFLHLGHAYSALLNADYAHRLGGRFLLRIEDIDVTRCKPAFAEAALEDLAWLGLAWETPVLHQSAHFDRYRAAAATLAAEGLLYPCFCTRNDLRMQAGEGAPRDPDGAPRYSGTCRALDPAARAQRLAAGERPALRLDFAGALARVREKTSAGNGVLGWDEVSGVLLDHRAHLAGDPACWGDVVLVRKGCPTSYHLAVVLDDAMQGVTHVVRGEDLRAATAIHRVLQRLLGLSAPVYHHHALITDDAGRKLAKSALSTPLRALRTEGVTPADIRRHLGFLGG
jgi:glutamyl-Q tRNA(Asp) synthetase